MIVVLLGVAFVAGSAAAARIGFSLQFTGSGNIDMNTQRFSISAVGPSQVDTVKITPHDGISYDVVNKMGSFAALSSHGAVQVFRTNITFDTQHSIHLDGSCFAKDIGTGQSLYFVAFGDADFGTGQFRNIDGCFTATGVFDQIGTGTAANGTFHLTVYGET